MAEESAGARRSQALAERQSGIADERRRWVRQWAVTTGAVSLVATVFDAVLLQYRQSYFTGGFLAVDYVAGFPQAAAFLGGSLLADAAVGGVLVAVAFVVLGRLRVRRNRAIASAIILGLTPLFAADFVEYRLLEYLGDAFDFRLLFDLAGRNPGEIIAVSSAHLRQAAGLAVGASVATVAGLWVLLWFLPSRGEAMARMPSWRSAGAPAGLFLAGIVVVTLLRSGSDVLDNGLRRKPTGRMLGAVAEVATDVDRDGYGVLGRPDDPGLFDRRIRPYALDVPGNGIDEDGVGGDLPATGDVYQEEPAHRTAWRSKPDVVLVVLESFRADARGAMVGGKPVTPVLDALAAQGIAPSHAYSHNGYTVQSRRHIFTGSTADLRGGGGGDTLVDDFKQNGYEVAYFSAQDESFGGPTEGVGFDRADVSYDARADRDRRYSDFSTAGSLAVPFDVLEERIGAFLDRRRTDRPLFLYVNFHDTHFPYHHRDIRPLVSPVIVEQSAISPDHADAVREMYMNTAANVDQAIGRVLGHVRRVLGREPGVIVLSDHGESLFDEGFLGHGYALNDAQTRIPLVVANLPLTIQEPFVQADLRNAIGRALEGSPSPGAHPTLEQSPSREVFQYLGLITRPAQIAFTRTSGRSLYDFREGRAKIGNDTWRRPDTLGGDERAQFLHLVQTWERMMLARPVATDE